MTDQRDPDIAAFIVELVESSPEAPRFDELEELATQPVGAGRVRPLHTVKPTKNRGWTVGIAAAAVTLILVGGVVRLAPFGGETSPASENSPPTTDVVTPTTEAAITTDTVPATTTTLAAVPVVPPGEGPKLSFVQAEAPTDREFDSGEWFNGALYVLSSSDGTQGTRELFRTRDGFTWELIPGFPGATNVEDSMLQTDSHLLVNVVMLGDDNRDIQSDPFIQVNTSTNGTDWISSSIKLPVPPIGSNMAGQFRLLEIPDPFRSDNFAVGPKGIVVTAAFDLFFKFEGFANSLVDPDEGIYVEVVDLDLDRGVMIVRFLDENNDMEQIGDLRDIDLKGAGFSDAFSNLLDAMAADPDWNPLVPGFLAGVSAIDHGSVSVGYAWFSSDGVTWQRVPNASSATTPTVPSDRAIVVDTTGPLDGGQFSTILATPDGFVATAPSPVFDSSVVWQSPDGMTWTEATGLTSGHGLNESRLVEWKGEPVEQISVFTGRDDYEATTVWTLGLPRRQVFSDVPIRDLALEFSEFGLIGVPNNNGAWERDRTQLLFSVDGTSWNRWEPAEFPATGQEAGGVWVVGVGADFVVIQLREWDESSGSPSYSLWVGVVP